MLLRYQRNALIWAFLIFCLCTMPSSSLPKFRIEHIIGIDKLVHAFIYFVFYILMWFGLRKKNQVTQTEPLHKDWFWYALSCFIFGVVIEILQGTFFNRGMELMDIVANTSGIVLGVVFTFLLANKTA